MLQIDQTTDRVTYRVVCTQPKKDQWRKGKTNGEIEEEELKEELELNLIYYKRSTISDHIQCTLYIDKDMAG